MARRDKVEEKILDVDASMQGTLTFKDPVNLRINGSFDGKLDTKGSLTIGENATVKADIQGEEIIVGGKITGNVVASKDLKILSRAHVIGDITTPRLGIEPGAVLQGKCDMMSILSGKKESFFNARELAAYLEVDESNILNWAKAGKLPAVREENEWKFDRQVVDEWIAKEKSA
ncbi:MAG: polymer-forming cytoskeletal protein [Candidatus Omnitrophota bacterium]